MRLMQAFLAAAALCVAVAPTVTAAQEYGEHDGGYGWRGDNDRHDWAERREEWREEQRENRDWRPYYSYGRPYYDNRGVCWWEPRTYIDQWGDERSKEVQVCRR